MRSDSIVATAGPPSPPLPTLTMTSCPVTVPRPGPVSSAPTCQDCDLFPGACSWFSSLLRTPSSSPLQGDAQGLGLLPSSPLSALWLSVASGLAAAACSSGALCVSSGPDLTPELLRSWSPAYVSHPELLMPISTRQGSHTARASHPCSPFSESPPWEHCRP